MQFFEGGFDAAKMEENILAFWDAHNIFRKSLEKTKNGKPFTFYDGPPFATGLPHYGHILASTIKDLAPRYHTMRGRFVRRRWGWDCHGLPIEEIVERKLGISGKKQIEEIGIKKFNETCRSQVLTYVEEWGKMVRRIARWVEFDNSYKTMDRDYMESVWWAFKQIYDKDLVYEGRKVLLYCPRCETPISNFEVAMDNSYKDVTEKAVTVKFRVTPGQKIGDWEVPENTFLLAWTTTPWTLPGNVALAVGKDIEYLILPKMVGNKKEFLIIAKATHEKSASATENQGDFVESGSPTAYLPEETHQGIDLVGLSYEPLFDVSAVTSDKTFKVYAADFVNTEEGTGIVHTAVVYGEDDYQLGLREGLPVVPLLDEKGRFNDKAPAFLRGKTFEEANDLIRDDLGLRPGGSLIFSSEKHMHSYPHCWRCGSKLFYNAIPAWFIDIQKIKNGLKADLDDRNEQPFNWFPAHLKHGRYEKSVEAAPDWNISRNRYWGNPIPVWKCEQCGGKTVIGSLAELALKSAPPRNRYWVMRHGEAEGNVRQIIDSGDQGFHLTERGREEVRASAASLKDAGIDMIIASDILRAKETAEIAQEVLGVKADADKRLRELQVGALSGQPTSAYTGAFPTYEERFVRTPEGGESLETLRARMWGFLKEIDANYEGKNILIVSHDDPIWMLMQAAEGWSDAETIRGKTEHGDVFIHPGEVRAMAFKNLPRNASGAVDMHRPYIDEIALRCGECGGTARKITEIFDSWVEAGSMPFAEYHYPFENKETFESRFPAQFVAEYIAQTRAWFYVTHVISHVIYGKPPFENVVTTGTILAEDGSKMSKSKENYPDPWLVINKYGVDTLRFYLMNSVVMQADNLNFSVRDLENVHRKVVMIIYNVYNYFRTYAKEKGWRAETVNEGMPHRLAESPDGSVLDRWISARTKALVNDGTRYLDAYDTVWATRTMEKYIDDLSTWYLRRSRGRDDAGFFSTLYRTLVTASKVIAPVMPHLAEAIYLSLAEEFGDAHATESVHLADWPETQPFTKEDEQTVTMMDMVREAASWGHMFRKANNIPVKQPLAAVNVPELPEEYASVLLDELNIEKFDLSLSGESAKTIEMPAGKRMFIDDTLTPELLRKGYARSMERFIQELRKKKGLKVGTQIVLVYETEDEDLKRAIANIDRRKVYVGEMKEGGAENGEVLAIGGMTVRFALEY